MQQVEENFKDYNEKISSNFWQYLREKDLIDVRSPIE